MKKEKIGKIVPRWEHIIRKPVDHFELVTVIEKLNELIEVVNTLIEKKDL